MFSFLACKVCVCFCSVIDSLDDTIWSGLPKFLNAMVFIYDLIVCFLNYLPVYKRNISCACMYQAELENKLQQQITLSEQVLATQKEKITELQKVHKKAQENMEKLQLDIYGKESEILATRQDLKVYDYVLGLHMFLSVYALCKLKDSFGQHLSEQLKLTTYFKEESLYLS